MEVKNEINIEDFSVIKPIMKGGYGRVYLTKRKLDEKIFAMKVLKKDEMMKKNMLKNVQNEVKIMALSKSDFIVHLYYSLQTESKILLFMEYMIGGDVKSLIKMCGYLEESLAMLYVAEVTLALEYLHQKDIIHRDVKPDNMLIAHNGHIKLTDFGISDISFDRDITINDIMFSPKSTCDIGMYMRTPRQIQSLLKPINGFEKHSIKSKVNRKVIKVNDETHSSVKVDGTNPRQVLKRFSEYESNSASQNHPSKRCRFEDNKSLSAELSSQFLLMNVEERSDQRKTNPTDLETSSKENISFDSSSSVSRRHSFSEYSIQIPRRCHQMIQRHFPKDYSFTDVDIDFQSKQRTRKSGKALKLDKLVFPFDNNLSDEECEMQITNTDLLHEDISSNKDFIDGISSPFTSSFNSENMKLNESCKRRLKSDLSTDLDLKLNEISVSKETTLQKFINNIDECEDIYYCSTPKKTSSLNFDEAFLSTPQKINEKDFSKLQTAQRLKPLLGTPHYLAPELLKGLQHNAAVDWWALGVCFYEFLVGEHPFNGEDIFTLFQNIQKKDIIWPTDDEKLPESIIDLINRLLEVDPDKRANSKDIRSSDGFCKLSWSTKLKDEIPTFIPQPENELDTDYFWNKTNFSNNLSDNFS